MALEDNKTFKKLWLQIKQSNIRVIDQVIV
jgi:hypothetical protein